jgi:hypothetical protein
MAGGWGSDTFMFGQDFGHDTITDWQDGTFLGNDAISFAGQGLSLRDLSIVYDRSGATVGVIGTDDTIFIAGANRGTLTAEDFLF